jgi:hypothetical protein
MTKLKSEKYKGVLIKYRKEAVGVVAEANGFGHLVGDTKASVGKKMKETIASTVRWEKGHKKTRTGGAERVMMKEWGYKY